MKRVHLSKGGALDLWQNSPSPSHIYRWVEFDLAQPHVHRMMERNLISGTESALFQYILAQGEFKYVLLSTAGHFLERFTTLPALKRHAQFLLGLDELMAFWDARAC